MGTTVNQGRVRAAEHHHHHGLEYVIGGICVVILFATFAVIESVRTGVMLNPIYVGVIFGLMGTCIGIVFWARH
jgi:hypothetical protein